MSPTPRAGVVSGWRSRLPHLSLRSKVLVSGMGVVFLISLFVFIFYPRRQEAATIAAMQGRAQSTARMVALGVGIGLELDEYRAVTAAFAQVKQDPDLAYIVVFDTTGEVFAAYNPRQLPLDTLALRESSASSIAGDLLRTPVPVAVEGQRLGTLVLAQSLEAMRRQIRQDRLTALAVCGVILGVGALLSLLSAARIAAPIVRLKGAAEQVAAGNYDVAIEVRGDDEVGALEAAFAAMLDAVRDSTARIGAQRDRIAQQAAELEAARDAALASGRAKADFLATMSHEIRTPMNGVLGMLGLLLDGKLGPEERDRALMAHRSAESLLTIINDILDFSKIDAGKLTLETIDFDLRSTLEDVTTLLADRALSKGLELAFAVRRTVPPMLRGDPGRLRQVLVNLVGNALKFTSRGEVVIRVRLVQQDQDGVMLRFEVTDTGSGIAKAQIDQLFEAFSQADTSTTRRFGGTGLGLAISRRLTSLMGGEIGAEGTPGKGSTFWFTARFGVASVPDRVDVALPGAVRDLRILVVDDHRLSRLLVQQVFRSWNMHSHGAHSGARALTLLREAVASGQRYDVAIIDLLMPEMDGHTLARAIRADPILADTRLVLLTSMALRGNEREAREMGFDAYLTKPIRQSSLFDSLTAAMQGAPRSAIGRGGRRRGSGEFDLPEPVIQSRARILLAEDNVINQQVALGLLAKLGYRADVVANGLEALDCVGRLPYDLVLMDCQMAEMDGYEAATEIRRRERSGHRIPIIAMTANAMEGDEERCLAAGMDGYIAKPVSATKLREALLRWIPAELTADPPPGGPAGRPEPGTGESNGTDPINLSQLRSIVGSDEAALKRYLGLFLTTMPRLMGEVRGAMDRQDAPGLKRAAHTLKGACGNMGADEMARLGAAMERAPDPESAAALWAELEASFNRASAFARAI